MAPEDELVRRIAAYVSTQVPLNQRDVVTRAVCMTLATLMADPTFTEELVVVKTLREENQWLRTNYLILKQMMDRVGVRKAAPKRAAPKKSSPGPKKSSARPKNSAARSAPRSRKSSPNSSFRQGFDEMRG